MLYVRVEFILCMHGCETLLSLAPDFSHVVGDTGRLRVLISDALQGAYPDSAMSTFFFMVSAPDLPLFRRLRRAWKPAGVQPFCGEPALGCLGEGFEGRNLRWFE